MTDTRYLVVNNKKKWKYTAFKKDSQIQEGQFFGSRVISHSHVNFVLKQTFL